MYHSRQQDDLDTSWVVEDDLREGDQACEDEDNSLSASEQSIQIEGTTPANRQNRHTPQSPPPELIMPSIDVPASTPRKRVTPRTVTKPMAKSTPQLNSSPSRSSQPQSSSRGTSIHPRTTQPFRQDPAHQDSAFYDGLQAIFGHSIDWLLDILGSALRLLKKPLSWVLAAYLILIFFNFLQSLATNSLYRTLSPICRIPGSSFLNLPFCQYHQYYSSSSSNTSLLTLPITSDSQSSANVEFDALINVQSQFEAILSDTSTTLQLPMDMKRSELSIRDLKSIVQFSHLPSRNELLLEFDGFVETARIASYDLQKFNSHVGRGVDIVLSTARWTARMLDDIATQELAASNSGIQAYLPGFVNQYVLAPFQPLRFTEARLLDLYITHSQAVQSEIGTLITEAQSLLSVLANLEDRLDVMHAISIRDGVATKHTRDELLTELWTIVGGNKAKLAQGERELKVLARVGEYRKLAFAHVAATVVKLQGMSAELEELRGRVGMPEAELRALEADGGKVGRGGRTPLSVHVENIRLGVERLSLGRERARDEEREVQRRGLESLRRDDGAGVERGGDVRYISGL